MHKRVDLSRQSAPEHHTPVRFPVVADDGRIILDPWWGSIQPMSLRPDITTISELEVIKHIENNGVLIDTRLPEYVDASGIIPTAIPVQWEHIVEGLSSLNISHDTTVALYCNGPQCAATPRAIEKLLAAGWNPERILYYRGGLMDWIGQGLPVVPYQPSS
jgi:rhodanese-related sulfurtransferase